MASRNPINAASKTALNKGGATDKQADKLVAERPFNTWSQVEAATSTRCMNRLRGSFVLRAASSVGGGPFGFKPF